VGGASGGRFTVLVSTFSRPDGFSLRRPTGRLDDMGRRPRGDLTWLALFSLPAAVVLAWLITISLRAAISFVIVALVVGLHEHDRRWGICALFAFLFLAPELRRVLDLLTGYAASDPLSVAPFLATGLLGVIELYRVKLPAHVRRVLLVAAAGICVGLPFGLLHARSGIFAFVAYLCGLAAAVLGYNDGTALRASTLRRILLFGVVPIAVYAIVLQRLRPLPHWERAWLDVVSFNSIGADSQGHPRLFGTLNAPGTLAPLLGLALLAFLTVRPRSSRTRNLALLGGFVLAVALDLTFVRSSWLALPVAALAYVFATRGRSARLVFSIAAFIVVGTLLLAPVNPTARDVVTRASTFGNLSNDTSVADRSATLGATFPRALQAPLGHGLGTAGQPSQLNSSNSDLAVPDNGYLSLMYQVGPIGFLLVMAAIALMVRAAWTAARAGGPDQDMAALLFSMLVFLLVVLVSGDAFYGLGGLTLWFIGGQALALESQTSTEPGGRPADLASARS
jgi:O-antigen ligase